MTDLLTFIPCTMCNGTGEVQFIYAGLRGVEDCPRCEGKGNFIEGEYRRIDDDDNS